MKLNWAGEGLPPVELPLSPAEKGRQGSSRRGSRVLVWGWFDVSVVRGQWDSDTGQILRGAVWTF